RCGLGLRLAPLALDRLAQCGGAAPGGLDLLLRGSREAVRGDGELLREVPGREDLDVGLRVLDQALLDERLERYVGAGLEARLEVAQVHCLRERAMRAHRHGVLRVGAAQLAEAHVDRVLAALEAGPHLGGAGARLLPLDAATGVAALAGAQAAADAL